MNNICHICGRDNNLRNILDGELLEKLKLSATIKLEENAPVPKHVCNTCKIPYQLQEQEVEAERKWQAKNQTNEAQKSVEAVDEFIDDGEEFLNNEELLDDIKIEETQLMPATVDYVQYENVNTLKPSTVAEQQLKEAAHVLGTRKRYHCKQCNEWFSKIVEFKEHMKIHTTTREVYKCPDCARSYLYKKALKHHISREHKNPDKEKPVIQKGLIWTHEYSVEFRCDVCGKIFNTDKSLENHMSNGDCSQTKTEKLNGPFSCAYCEKIFQLRPRYRQHLRMHTNERPYKCNRCNKRYSTQTSVLVHLRNKHDFSHGALDEDEENMQQAEEKMQKEVAKLEEGLNDILYDGNVDNTVEEKYSINVQKDKQLLKKDYIPKERHEKSQHVSENATSSSPVSDPETQHEIIATDSRKHRMWKHEYSCEFKCEVCGKILESLRFLDSHMMSHVSNGDCRRKKVLQRIGPFSCAYCDKIFQRRHKYRDHLRTHTNERPYKCNRCNKRFREHDTVIQHIRTHVNDKPHQCQVCLTRFLRPSQLKTHSLLHDGKFQHYCDICNKEFAFKSKMLIHVKSHSKTHAPHQNYKRAKCEESFGRTKPKSHLIKERGSPIVSTVNRELDKYNENNEQEDLGEKKELTRSDNNEEEEFISIAQERKELLNKGFNPKTNCDEGQDDVQIISRKIVKLIKI